MGSRPVFFFFWVICVSFLSFVVVVVVVVVVRTGDPGYHSPLHVSRVLFLQYPFPWGTSQGPIKQH